MHVGTGHGSAVWGRCLISSVKVKPRRTKSYAYIILLICMQNIRPRRHNLATALHPVSFQTQFLRRQLGRRKVSLIQHTQTSVPLLKRKSILMSHEQAIHQFQIAAGS